MGTRLGDDSGAEGGEGNDGVTMGKVANMLDAGVRVEKEERPRG